MKAFTISEFKALVAESSWTHTQSSEEFDSVDREYDVEGENNEPELEVRTVFMGAATLTSELDGLEITYTEGWDYEQENPDSFSHSTEGQDEVWAISGFTVTDDDGDNMDAHELADYLTDAFSDIDWTEITGSIKTTVQADGALAVMDSDAAEQFMVPSDNAPDLVFAGDLVAKVSSSGNNARSDYSGKAGRWTELALYKTLGGNYVCHQVGCSQWQGERTRNKAKVCKTQGDVMAFFGFGWLAKELYDEAGIEHAQRVD